MVSAQLEKAREHYVSALNAQDRGDSLRCANQFEISIEILNDLSYVPDIESNRDYNDLSKAIVEDYEQYIAKIDSLGPQASIFALRANLDQYVENSDTSANEPTAEVIRTSGVPLVLNDLVQRNIAYFQGRGRSHMERWLSESGKYFPTMRRILAEEGVPEDLVYLTMVESGVNPVARSWAKAVGMWQFVKGTGRLYGLKGDYWYDERRNFELATRAAARHMKDLYDQFGELVPRPRFLQFRRRPGIPGNPPVRWGDRLLENPAKTSSRDTKLRSTVYCRFAHCDASTGIRLQRHRAGGAVAV